MVAMEGHPFCDSCCHSMKLMLRNIVQFAVLNVFSQVRLVHEIHSSVRVVHLFFFF